MCEVRSLTRIKRTPPAPEYAPATIHCGPKATRSSGASWLQTTLAADVHGGGGGDGGGWAASGNDDTDANKTTSAMDILTADPPVMRCANHRRGNAAGGQPDRSGARPSGAKLRRATESL
jgi:hypothetical protein